MKTLVTLFAVFSLVTFFSCGERSKIDFGDADFKLTPISIHYEIEFPEIAPLNSQPNFDFCTHFWDPWDAQFDIYNTLHLSPYFGDCMPDPYCNSHHGDQWNTVYLPENDNHWYSFFMGTCLPAHDECCEAIQADLMEQMCWPWWIEECEDGPESAINPRLCFDEYYACLPEGWQFPGVVLYTLITNQIRADEIGASSINAKFGGFLFKDDDPLNNEQCESAAEKVSIDVVLVTPTCEATDSCSVSVPLSSDISLEAGCATLDSWDDFQWDECFNQVDKLWLKFCYNF